LFFLQLIIFNPGKLPKTLISRLYPFATTHGPNVPGSDHPQKRKCVSSKKSFVLRIDEDTFMAIEKWAGDEFRSVNGQN
jgi:hypothetical protein